MANQTSNRVLLQSRSVVIILPTTECAGMRFAMQALHGCLTAVHHLTVLFPALMHWAPLGPGCPCSWSHSSIGPPQAARSHDYRQSRILARIKARLHFFQPGLVLLDLSAASCPVAGTFSSLGDIRHTDKSIVLSFALSHGPNHGLQGGR